MCGKRVRFACVVLAGLSVAASPMRAPEAWGAAEPARCHERVIFVMVDALRRDHLGVYGYERPISPTFDRLARGGLGHGTTVYNELIDSFTVFWNPKRFTARRVGHYTHAVDVLPTLLEAHGIEPDEDVTGRSLHAPPGQAPPDYPETGFVAELAERKALIRGEWKLILDRQQGTEVLYRVGPSGAIESEKIVAGDPERRAVLRAELEARTESSRAAEAPAPSVDPETQRELRELGYLEAGAPE